MAHRENPFHHRFFIKLYWQRHTHSFLYNLWLLSCYKGRVEQFVTETL